MESSGKEGRILVSQTTKQIIEHNFPTLCGFDEEVVIDIPNINVKISGYFLINTT